MSLRERFAALMIDIAREDPSLVVLVSDISHGILKPFAAEFPSRYYNVGICEPSVVNMAAGMNHVGLTPVVHTIAPFLVERSFEQLKLDFGYQRKSVSLVSVGGAFDYSRLGCSHHSYADVALVSQIPGSQVFMPGSEYELEQLFWGAYKTAGIKYFRLTENPHNMPLPSWDGRVGRGVRIREGEDVTIAVVGAQLANAADAASALEQRGVNAEVLYFPTFKPFDADILIDSALKTGRVVTVEELSSRDGLYARVCEVLVEIGPIHVKQLAIHDFIHDYGGYLDLCNAAGLNPEAIIDGCMEVYNRE